MLNKPNILKGEQYVNEKNRSESLISDKDVLSLESKSCRVRVKFSERSNFLISDFVSGLVVCFM